MLFLAYTVVGSVYSFALYTFSAYDLLSSLAVVQRGIGASNLTRQWLAAKLVVLVINLVVLLIVIVAVGGLLLFQARIVRQNVTTVERKARRWAEHDAKLANEPFRWQVSIFHFVCV